MVSPELAEGRPFGEDEWVKRTASELRLEHTIRPEGRPPNADDEFGWLVLGVGLP
jgi:hypothetical protein